MTVLSPPAPYPRPGEGAISHVRAVAGDAPSLTRVWVSGRIAIASIVGLATLGAFSEPASSLTQLEVVTAAPLVRPASGIEPGGGTTAWAALANDGVVVPAAASSVNALTRLHADSGLTWDQLARLFGVSRRAVHLWASGRHMNARNVERLGAVIRLVGSAPVGTSEGRRTWLFTPQEDGVTPIEKFMARYRNQAAPLSGSGYTPAGLLGIDIE